MRTSFFRQVSSSSILPPGGTAGAAKEYLPFKSRTTWMKLKLRAFGPRLGLCTLEMRYPGLRAPKAAGTPPVGPPEAVASTTELLKAFPGLEFRTLREGLASYLTPKGAGS